MVLKARTPGQRHYVRELTMGQAPFVVAAGPAGTGKTYIAVLYAIQELRAGRIKKIVISRPNVGAGDDLGFLPGDIDSKMQPWVAPIADAFLEYYSAYEFENMIKAKTIEITPLAFIRGRTFKNSLVLLDEAQNTTLDQMKAFLTRIGEGTRYIITGDVEQHDRGHGISGLKDLLRRHGARYGVAEETEEIITTNFAIFKMGIRDVVRHPAIEEVLSLYA